MLRRDAAPSKPIAQFFIYNVLSDHPSLRATSIRQAIYKHSKEVESTDIHCRAIVKILRMIKIQTWSKNDEELWLDNWHNPLSSSVDIDDPDAFMQQLARPLSNNNHR